MRHWLHKDEKTTDYYITIILSPRWVLEYKHKIIVLIFSFNGCFHPSNQNHYFTFCFDIQFIGLVCLYSLSEIEHHSPLFRKTVWASPSKHIIITLYKWAPCEQGAFHPWPLNIHQFKQDLAHLQTNLGVEMSEAFKVTLNPEYQLPIRSALPP